MAGHGENISCDRLNNFFIRKKIKAFAYRLKQSKGVKQWTDVLVDSQLNKYYLAIEVKAKRGKYALNFNGDFTTDEFTGEHQLDRQIEFSRRTGRAPYVVLFCRMGAGRKQLIYVFESIELQKRMKRGDVSVLSKDFDSLNRKNELWRILHKKK